ncbi:nitrous oxide reductase accessory protein NosL [Thalassotalea sp. HSM 43]|uniref:nitrous oxide reductase accessory protein NosL n=1 Tax=Thalassotalea sp. HSM 43 TaxID=2552945 RepID=UPI0010816E4A|nr:nitrous oxide reductase accessory protein NosL [Thalassotalea sp. HSM 43]QBY03186.1 nitrous oxide reductase accessory protein NosL [Thalassotalea sp. HSM 43]
MKTLYLTLFMFIACSLLVACDNTNQQKMLLTAQAIESGDECHLCGMLISDYSGPKGQLYRSDQGETVHKFCSTRDLFSFYLDPENTRNITAIFVHDMSKVPWDEPNDSYFIDAKSAWYVAGSSQQGAMGKTLASFSQKQDAIAFSDKFGGEVIDFNAIDFNALR